MKTDATKVVNQAWRKKPRQFAPKSTLGCRTCKIRRVKCDLTQPSCLKCHSTGRTCDGYSHHRSEIMVGPESDSNHHRGTIMSTLQPKGIAQSLAPLMVLQASGSVQAEAMSFFEYISIKHLNEYQPCQSWRRTLMFFSQTVPSVRYAALAVALMHRNFIHSRHRMLGHTPLACYNRAIQLLLEQQASGSMEKTAITLLVCYLFTCFEHLAGNDPQAMKHLRGGVEMSRQISQSLLESINVYDESALSCERELVCQVIRQIRRLDMQAVLFLVDWTPADVHDILTSQLLPAESAFQSLDQAAEHLQVLTARVMRLRNSGQSDSPTDGVSMSPWTKDVVLEQLDAWLRLFNNTLQQRAFEKDNSEAYCLVSLLRLQHTMAWTYISSHGPGREMEFDKFLSQFQTCVAMADDISTTHERYAGSLKPTFTPEIGILPILYIIGVKCRHPIVRRQALRIIRRQPIREAAWDSVSTAAIVERVIEIEESGLVLTGEIPVWKRIEYVSWIHQVEGLAPVRLDMEYTFCTQQEVHKETLVL
ncbi:hypothetical protein B0I35DRAFT_393912 [Stachybotrys elegans]|uniref:Zn(2)-C6 fungal-type domain-containing protein n=1 Tax=Stachybotrys elegans TaxID=80388 RepID=A0A8K0STV8_9HYPO|nr:hypothetical protein B0I35DRAFT_393912 [Stachybotrys elegans]